MKRMLAVMLVLTMLCGCFVLPTSAAGETTPADLKSSLIVAYDFEGNTTDFQYMDKSMDFSTAENNAANNLSASGTGVVTVENGVATVPNTATPATLKTTTITDLKELSGYTVYMKVKANGSYSGSWVNLINISGFFRTYISAKKDSAYTLAATQKGNANYAYTYPTERTFTEDQWIYMAYTLDFDGTTGKMTATAYLSADGVTYASASKDMTDTSITSLSCSNNITIGGASNAINVSYDDVMIFNRALNATEVASIDSAFARKSAKDSLMVAYDFEGLQQDVQLKDKATAGTSDDKLKVFGTGTVTLENGVATVSGAKTKLYAAKSADLAELSGYTVYMKIKADGTYTSGNWVSVLTAGGLFRTYIDNQSDGAFGMQAKTGYNLGYAYNYPTDIKMNGDQWLYMAYTLELIGATGKIEATAYLSLDGKNYVSSAKVMTDSNTKILSNTGNIELGNCNVDGMTVSYDDVMIFNRALTANEVAGLSTMKVSRDRVGFVGFQTRNVTADSYDIRFVSVIDSVNYQEIGYDIVVKNGDTVINTTPYACQKVFSKIIAMNYEKTAEELGGQYIIAVGINGFDQVADGVSFEITPYYKDAAGKHSLSTVKIVNAHSDQPVCEFIA